MSFDRGLVVRQVTGWNKALGTVYETYMTLQEIQRTWSYLEPLFIGSEEVKRELPQDAVRFAGIDVNVKKVSRAQTPYLMMTPLRR
jgi:dynein heavy chain, axonemal